MRAISLVVILLIAASTAMMIGPESAIVGGSDATIAEFPFMAGVFNLGIPYCGGSIINERSVLTAAHCILIRNAATISVSVGSSRRRGQGGSTYRAVRATIHPEYIYTPDPFLMRADVAVIRTLTRIRFGSLVQPIPLGVNAVTTAAQVVLTGWGLLGDSSIRDRADQLQKLEMIAMPNLACSLLFIGTEAEGVVSSEMLCAFATGNRGACGGDSGGPIVNNQGEVVGVASWTVRPCGSHPTVFKRVAHHLEWIQSQL